MSTPNINEQIKIVVEAALNFVQIPERMCAAYRSLIIQVKDEKKLWSLIKEVAEEEEDHIAYEDALVFLEHIKEKTLVEMYREHNPDKEVT